MWWKQNYLPNNHVYQMVNIMQEIKSGIVIYKYIYI